MTSPIATPQQQDYEYAVRLARYLVVTHFPNANNWQPLDTISGVLSQIDNMITAWKVPAGVAPNTDTPQQVARELVDELFTDSKGRKAERLCLYDDQQYLGGWSKQPIIDRITTALEARDAEIERLKAELDEARREILIYLETRIPAALEATAKERDDLICHMRIHSGYPNCGYMQMTTAQKTLYDAIWDKEVAMMEAEDRQLRMAAEGITEEDVAETRSPSHYPENR